MDYGRQIFFLLIFFLSFNARAQIPVADISTTSDSVILADSTDLSCDYTPATGTTTTNVSFTYKANDGNLDSLEVFTVFLEIE